MRITVENFKGITKLEDFKFEHLSVLAGTNSGGKSSLVQLLMLLKQSLEARSPETPLKLNKPYVSLGRFESLVRRAVTVKSFKVTIILDIEDLDPRLWAYFNGKYKIPGIPALPTNTNTREIHVTAEFKKPSTKIVVANFEIRLVGDQDHALQITRKPHGKSFEINSNFNQVFFRRNVYDANGAPKASTKKVGPVASRETGRVGFVGFIPVDVDIDSDEHEFVAFSPIVTHIRNSIHKAFDKISYIGPLREEPRDFYYHDDDLVDHIGNKGENAAFLLSKHSEDEIVFAEFSQTPDGTNYSFRKGTLREAVNYWLCEIFQLALEIRVDRAKTNRYLHSITLKSKDGSIIPITHVGFGVSQIFPILVEGLRKGLPGRLIILEQPEIHLHPRVQSWLFDFVRTTRDVSFLIETHSDHFVTRLRRRVAEDLSSTLVNEVNLTFVTADENGTSYERLKLNDAGALNRWPKGFFDQYEEDLRAIVKAQAVRRRPNPT